MKICPFRAKEIQARAIFCRYCGRDLPQFPKAEDIATEEVPLGVEAVLPIWKQTARIGFAILTVLAGAF